MHQKAFFLFSSSLMELYTLRYRHKIGVSPLHATVLQQNNHVQHDT